MNLTVVFDDLCPLCRECRQWLAGQEVLVPLQLVAASDPGVQQWLGGYAPVGQELVVVDSDSGAIWIGPDAFIVVIGALARYSALADRLQGPVMRPLAGDAFRFISTKRKMLSSLIGEDTGCDSAACVRP